MNMLVSFAHRPSKLLLTAALLLPFSLATFAGGVQAQDKSSSELVSALPAEIPEIVTGGTWKHGDIGGVYRAVVIMSDADKNKADLAVTPEEASFGERIEATGMPGRKAEVFIQWISYENGRENPKVVKTVSIKEFNEKQLHNAFLAMDTLHDNEMTLLVTSYDDRKDKDVAVSVKATVPGSYETTKTK